MAMLFDAFDGVLARKYGLNRPFGGYLDSFADVFIYLLAPSACFVNWGFSADWQLLILLMFVVSGIIRWSVFNEVGNIQRGASSAYLGMPVFWSAFITAGWYGIGIIGVKYQQPMLACCLVIYSFLMNYNGTFYKPRNPVLMGVVIGCIAVGFIVSGW